MKTKAIFFDLDGTLLPMDQDLFVKDYLHRLAAYMAQHGYDPKAVAETVMEGVAAMVKNGWLSGYETGEFKPKGFATRAETAVFFDRLSDVLN